MITLTVTETFKGGKLVAVGASAGRGAVRHITAVLGRAWASLAPGRSKTVKVALNRAGTQLLNSRHTLHVTVTVTRSGRRVRRGVVTFHAPARKKHR
jgi:hypothetical protein